MILTKEEEKRVKDAPYDYPILQVIYFERQEKLHNYAEKLLKLLKPD